MRDFSSEWIGFHARALLQQVSGQAIAVWRRSFYVRLGGQLCCIGSDAIGNGPRNVIVSAATDVDWRDYVALNSPGTIHEGTLELGLARIRFKKAAVWHPPTIPEWTPLTLRSGLEHFDHVIRRVQLLHEGLGCYITSDQHENNYNHTAAAAAPTIQAIANWFRDGHSLSQAPEFANLLGLGPGLTPSGDDFLVGVMVTTHSLGKHTAAITIWNALRENLSRTNQISTAHLGSAAHGYFSSNLHELLNSLLCGSDSQIEAAMAVIIKDAHTSNWDCLAGIITTLHAIQASPGRAK
ncbi:MAG: DUF2877 domain-containing protein [Hyphomicrobiaceae bacterium]